MFQSLAHQLFQLRRVPTHPVEQIDAVGIVVAGDELLVAAVAGVLPGGLENRVHGPAGDTVHHVVTAVAIAPAGVVEVGQVELVYPLVLGQLQQFR